MLFSFLCLITHHQKAMVLFLKISVLRKCTKISLRVLVKKKQKQVHDVPAAWRIIVKISSNKNV